MSYAQLYFDSTPTRNPRRPAPAGGVRRRLLELPLEAARGARDHAPVPRGPGASWRGCEALHGAKTSAEEVLHPPEDDDRFGTPDVLRAAWDEDEIEVVPRRPGAHRAGPRREHGRAGRADRRRARPLPRAAAGGARDGALHRRPDARVRRRRRRRSSSRRRCATRSTSGGSRAATDEATRNYSLHTTGWAFDIARDYRSRRQALAFQFVLDRLQVLNVIAWAREPRAIHITAAGDAEGLLPLLERLDDG